VIICADGYGLSEDVNEAILDLARRGVVTAVSCMVALPQCRRLALEPLLALRDQIDLGLHFSLVLPEGESLLTAGPSLRHAATFRGALQAAVLGRFKQADLTAELAAQLDLFQAEAGMAPDFVDGHLHVHQFPGIRDAFARCLACRPGPRRPYVRNTRMRAGDLLAQGHSYWKCQLLSWWGQAFKRRALASGLETNNGFAGAYDYRYWGRYEGHLPGFLRQLTHRNALLMTHPGRKEPWRRNEYENLRSAAIAPCTVTRFVRTGNAALTAVD
jgi:chitin disaccharide deacetylase